MPRKKKTTPPVKELKPDSILLNTDELVMEPVKPEFVLISKVSRLRNKVTENIIILTNKNTQEYFKSGNFEFKSELTVADLSSIFLLTQDPNSLFWDLLSKYKAASLPDTMFNIINSIKLQAADSPLSPYQRHILALSIRAVKTPNEATIAFSLTLAGVDGTFELNVELEKP